MPKFWSGVSFERRKVKEGDKEKEIVIAMTEKEYEDRSYRDYLWEAEEEKTRDELRKIPQGDPARRNKRREEVGALLKEYGEYKERQQRVHENTRKFY